MAGTIRNYFAGGHTARGFTRFYESNLCDLAYVFILNGGSRKGKTALMKQIAEVGAAIGNEVERMHCASDNQFLDGVILPALKIGVVEETVLSGVEPTESGAIFRWVTMGPHLDRQDMEAKRDEAATLHSQIRESYQKAYEAFAEALRIHDEWEAIYIRHMNVAKADECTQNMIQTLFGGRQTGKQAVVRHRFLGAATPNGPVDFIQNLTEDIPQRFFIKGRPGSGKSTMLKKLAAAAEERGFDVEVYHCGFDPNSLDMVIVRELGVAVFDSTAPHEYFPEREGDEIIDMYEIAIEPGTDEAYAEELRDIVQRYTAKMKEATTCLAVAKSLYDEWEGLYQADLFPATHVLDLIIREIQLIAEDVSPEPRAQG